MKKAVFLGLLILTMIFITSCGGNENGSTTEGSVQTDPPAEEQQKEPPHIDAGGEGTVPNLDWND